MPVAYAKQAERHGPDADFVSRNVANHFCLPGTSVSSADPLAEFCKLFLLVPWGANFRVQNPFYPLFFLIAALVLSFGYGCSRHFFFTRVGSLSRCLWTTGHGFARTTSMRELRYFRHSSTILRLTHRRAILQHAGFRVQDFTMASLPVPPQSLLSCITSSMVHNGCTLHNRLACVIIHFDVIISVEAEQVSAIR